MVVDTENNNGANQPIYPQISTQPLKDKEDSEVGECVLVVIETVNIS